MGEQRNKDASERIAAIVASGGAGAASSAVAGSGALLAGFFALFPAAVGLMIWAGFEWRKSRATSWWQSVCESGWETPEEVQGILEANQEHAWARETVLESVRRLLEAVDDAAAAPLGSLAAEYVKSRTAPDWFFRGLARMLAELSRAELQELSALARDIAEMSADGATVERQGDVDGGEVLRFTPHLAPPRDEVEEFSDQGATATAADVDSEAYTCPASLLRLCWLLKMNGLAKEGTSGYFGSTTGPNVMVVERSVFERIHSHLRAVER